MRDQKGNSYLSLFGLLFDPEKRIIIISQFIVGLLCFVFFIVLKLKKTNN